MKYLIILVFSSIWQIATAQNEEKSFKGYFFNNEYEVYIRMNLYEKNMSVPGHEILGELPGYLGKQRNNFFWLIVDCSIQSNQKAELQFVNDYGSEDFEAELIKKNDSTFILKHKDGSPLKVPNKGKWQKLPKEIQLNKNITKQKP